MLGFYYFALNLSFAKCSNMAIWVTLNILPFLGYWPVTLLGKHIITDFILVLFVSIKAAMDLLSIAILLQLKFAYFIAQ